MKEKRSQAAILKKILGYLKKYRFLIALSLILAGISVALTLYVPILVGNAIDLIIGPGQVDLPGVLVILKRIVIVMLLTAAAQWVMNTCNNKITYFVIKDIRESAFRKLEILPLKYMDNHSTGEIVSRVIADVDTFADGLLMGFTQLFTGVMTIAGTLIFMLLTNVKITLVVVLITPVSLFVARFIAKKTYHMFQEQSVTRGEQTGLIDEVIGNQKVVKAFSQEEEVKAQLDRKSVV